MGKGVDWQEWRTEIILGEGFAWFLAVLEPFHQYVWRYRGHEPIARVYFSDPSFIECVVFNAIALHVFAIVALGSTWLLNRR